MNRCSTITRLESDRTVAGALRRGRMVGARLAAVGSCLKQTHQSEAPQAILWSSYRPSNFAVCAQPTWTMAATAVIQEVGR